MVQSPVFHHRIAVANIATPCHVIGEKDTFVLAIMNDNARKAGRIEYGAVGGGALITESGRSALRELAPTTFELHDDGIQFDARMTFEGKSEGAIAHLQSAFLLTLLDWARFGKRWNIELEVTREFEEELVDDTPGILSRNDLSSIHTRLVGWRRGTTRQSIRGAERLLTTPLYFCHEVVFEDQRVLDALLNDSLGRVRRISPEELATTNGGQKEGRTHDGHVLFTNVFDPERILAL